MIPLWATANSHQTQLKINQLGFFIPPKMACRVNRFSFRMRYFTKFSQSKCSILLHFLHPVLQIMRRDDKNEEHERHQHHHVGDEISR